MDKIEKIRAEIDESFTKMMLKESTPKIKGWVARDEFVSMCRFHIGKKPERFEEDGLRYWVGGSCWNLPRDVYPDLKWEDEPIEVELEIHRV